MMFRGLVLLLLIAVLALVALSILRRRPRGKDTDVEPADERAEEVDGGSKRARSSSEYGSD